MSLSDSFFGQKFGITEHDLESYLSEALAAGGEYADLYFEYLATSQLSIDESIVKSAVQGVSLGVGVRVISGERTGYAYSDDLSPEKIRKAARVAACIANGPSKVDKTGFEEARRRDLYPIVTAPSETSLAERVELVKRADRAARAADRRVFQVQASYVDSLRQVLVATSDGVLSTDRQPLARLGVSVLARRRRWWSPSAVIRAAADAWAWTFSRPRRRRNISRAKRFGRPSCSWMRRRRRRAR